MMSFLLEVNTPKPYFREVKLGDFLEQKYLGDNFQVFHLATVWHFLEILKSFQKVYQRCI